jgi:hypothetical protein
MISDSTEKSGMLSVKEKQKHEDSAAGWDRAKMAGGIKRRVARVAWTVFPQYFKPFCPVEGMEFTPFPLIHGGE